MTHPATASSGSETSDCRWRGDSPRRGLETTVYDVVPGRARRGRRERARAAVAARGRRGERRRRALRARRRRRARGDGRLRRRARRRGARNDRRDPQHGAACDGRVARRSGGASTASPCSDACVTGGAAGAAAGHAHRDGRRRRRARRARAPVLRRFAKKVVHTGPLGSGCKMKLCNNLMTYLAWIVGLRGDAARARRRPLAGECSRRSPARTETSPSRCAPFIVTAQAPRGRAQERGVPGTDARLRRDRREGSRRDARARARVRRHAARHRDRRRRSWRASTRSTTRTGR